jgi:hypothetical protein
MVMIFSGKMMAIIFACVFTVQVGIMMMYFTNPNAVRSEDKSTSISCDGIGMCEKTECVNGVCDTSPTNSSSIVDTPSSQLSRANDEDSQSADNTTSTSMTPLDQRMSLREGLNR